MGAARSLCSTVTGSVVNHVVLDGLFDCGKHLVQEQSCFHTWGELGRHREVQARPELGPTASALSFQVFLLGNGDLNVCRRQPRLREVFAKNSFCVPLYLLLCSRAEPLIGIGESRRRKARDVPYVPLERHTSQPCPILERQDLKSRDSSL